MNLGLRSDVLKSARRELAGNSHAQATRCALWALIQAAHPMQRRTGVTEHSRHVWPRPSRPVGYARHPGGDQAVGRGKGRHCFAWFSRDVRDAGGSLVERKHERAHSPMTGQSLVEAVTGDPRSDRHLGTAIGVRVVSQPFFFPWTGGRCKDTCNPSAGNVLRMHDFSLGPSTSAYRARGKVKLSSSEEAREEALLTISRQALELFLLKWWCWKDLRETECDCPKTSQKYCRYALELIRTILWPFFPHRAWHAAKWRNQYNATRKHWEPFLRASLDFPSPSPKLGLPLEMTTWARTRLLTPAWPSSSGPNGPGAGSLRFTHWVCTRRICFRVSCVIGATHILKLCQSLSHSVNCPRLHTVTVNCAARDADPLVDMGKNRHHGRDNIKLYGIRKQKKRKHTVWQAMLELEPHEVETGAKGLEAVTTSFEMQKKCSKGYDRQHGTAELYFEFPVLLLGLLCWYFESFEWCDRRILRWTNLRIFLIRRILHTDVTEVDVRYKFICFCRRQFAFQKKYHVCQRRILRVILSVPDSYIK